MGKFRHNGRIVHGRSVRASYWAGLGAGCLALAGCAGSNVASNSGADQSVADTAPVNEQVAPKPAKPTASSRRVVRENVNYSAVGTASWYGADFHGRRTANGETYNMHSLTAAHPTLPLQSQVRVTNLANHRSLVLRVNDRGPFVGARVIDVSAKSAQLLGFYDRGLAKVKVEYVARAQPTNADAPQAPRMEEASAR